jgi:hypothetical protein
VRSSLATSLAAARQNGQPPSNSKSGRRGGGTSPSHDGSKTKRSMSPHSIDAIHLATALGSDLACIVTYDEQLRAVAMTRRAS